MNRPPLRTVTPESISIDPTQPHAARMYDYLLGGYANFEVDRVAVERAAVAVGGVDNARVDVRANRDFVLRAVRFLTVEAGVRQFLDIGSGIPNGDNIHTVAQLLAPDARAVYVDNDPVVLAHSHAYLDASSAGTTVYLHGDLREPDPILSGAADVLDFARPVALVLAAVLHLVPDEEAPYDLIERLLASVPVDSYLVASHLTADFAPAAMADLSARLNGMARETFVLRDKASFERFLAGLELVPPGVVRVDEWHPDERKDTPPSGWVPSLYGAVGRKASPR